MIIFLKTRHKYDSYQDFWRLVELSGYSSLYLDEVDLASEHTYIFTPHNGEFDPIVAARGRDAWDKRRCKIIWWLLERPDDGNPVSFSDRLAPLLPLVDGCFASDRSVAAMHPAFTHAIVGSHPDLNDGIEPAVVKQYDFAHMSYFWGRRESLYREIRAKGLTEAPNAYGASRSVILSQTRLMVNANQYPKPVVAPLRFAIAAACHLPVISERMPEPYPHEENVDLALAEYEELPGRVVQLLRDQPKMDALAAAMHERLCVEWTFRKAVEDAVARCLP